MTFPITIDASALASGWAAKWQDYCLGIDQPLADTLGSHDAAQAAFTVELRNTWPDFPVGSYADVVQFGSDPAAYLWFAHAISLGESDRAEAVYDALMKFAKDSITNLNEFQETMEGLFTNWQGVAAENCRRYVGKITDFMEAQRRAALDLASVILAFRAVVENGQKDLGTVMTALEDAVQQKIEAERKAEHSSLLHDLEAVGMAALAIAATVAGQPEIAPLLLSLSSAVASVGVQAYESQQAVIDASQGWDLIRDAYLHQCRLVRDAVGDQIRGQILTNLAKIELVTHPQLPNVPASAIGYGN
jgi:hypothetical protein